MCRQQAADLDPNRRGINQKRDAQHAVRHRLGGHGKEQKVGLHATLVLVGSVGEGDDEATEEEEAGPHDGPGNQLRVLLAFVDPSVESTPMGSWEAAEM
jgi:hypothetical protein